MKKEQPLRNHGIVELAILRENRKQGPSRVEKYVPLLSHTAGEQTNRYCIIRWGFHGL